MIQDIFPYKLDNQYQDIKPQAGSYVLFIKNSSLLLKINNEALEFPRFEQVSDNCSNSSSESNTQLTANTTYLFSISGQAFFLVNRPEAECCAASEKLAAAGYAWYDIKDIRKQSPKHLSFAAAVAGQIGKWYRDNGFCGKCGQPLHHSRTERAMCCEACGNIIYPKICPVVIVGVINQDKILLTKYADRGHYDRYALVAGFAEIGETIEETVKREVMEETGVKVKNIRYYKSQPWPFSDSLLFGFFCELDGSDEITMDPGELSVAEWVPRDKMRIEADDISLTNEMMVVFKNNL